MKSFLHWFGVVALILCPAQFARAAETTNRTTSASPELTNQIAKLEADWNTAHLNNDATAVEKMCADDLTVGVPGMPPINKAGAVDALRGGRLKFMRYETSETSIRVYNNDTAIVTGRLQRTREMGDKLMTDDLRFTKVWVRLAGQWQVTAFHASPFGP